MATHAHRRPRPKNPALAEAVKRAGGQSALARAIGRSQPTVWSWLFETGRVSAEDAIAIQRHTGVPAASICPALAEFAAAAGEARAA